MLDPPESLYFHVIPSGEVRIFKSPTIINLIVSVLNPFPIVHCSFKVFPELSCIPVVSLILYVEFLERLELGVTVNVLFELELEGDEDIWTHELKLSEET